MARRRTVAALLAATLTAAPVAVVPAAALGQASTTTAPAAPTPAPSGAFGGLPQAPQDPAPTQAPTSNVPNPTDNSTSGNTIIFIVVSAVLVFGIIVWVIRRDLAHAVPGGGRSRGDDHVKNKGPKEQVVQQRAERKQRQRQKSKQAKRARRANRPR